MSKKAYIKVQRAMDILKAEGVPQGDRAALYRAGHTVVYDAMRERGLVWSVDLQAWRPTRRPHADPANGHAVGALSGASLMIKVRYDTHEEAIAQLAESFELQGYTVKSVQVRDLAKSGRALIFMVVE
jgi:hypothetical protein